jgi:GNAT superfamily N-acetyltransferase
VSIRGARPDDAETIGRIHVETWRAAYRGIVPEGYLAGLSAVARAGEWRELLEYQDRSRFVLVAEGADGDVCGFAAAGPEREGEPGYAGELYALYLRPSHQRLGLGRALVRGVAAGLAEAGMNSMLLWVFEANADARAFYQKLGGSYVRGQPMTLGGATFTEVAYGWRSLDVLVGLT